MDLTTPQKLNSFVTSMARTQVQTSLRAQPAESGSESQDISIAMNTADKDAQKTGTR